MPCARTQRFWVLAIPMLLLAGWLAARQINTDAFSSDEVASMIVAGGAHFGPFTPIEAWNRVAENSPDQALGFALILSSWGQIFGWSEVSTRTLPFFAGLLALAWVYRAGHDLVSPAVGLVAVTGLALSVFFVTYMRVARVFTIVALLVSLVLWSYWRVVLHPRKPGIAAQIGLVAGSIGLLYAHYFAALLLVALGVYHLLLAPRNARWWRATLLLVVAAVAFLPEFNVFVQGYERNLGKEDLHTDALALPESVSQLIYDFSNGSLALPGIGGLALFVVAVAGTALYSYRVRPAAVRNLGFVLFVTVGLLALILGANAWLRVMTLTRIRYMMPLWPLLALLTGVGLIQWGRFRPRLSWLALGGWIVFSLWSNLATDLQYQFDLFTRYPLHRARKELLRNGSDADLLVIDGFFRGDGRTREFYLGYGIPMDRAFVYPTRSVNELRPQIESHLRVWLATEDRTSRQSDELRTLLQEDFVQCAMTIDEQFLVLELYARVDTFCPGGDGLFTFDDTIALSKIGLLVMDNSILQIDMAWIIDQSVPPDTYSVGLYVFDAATNEFVAQADFGLPPPPFAPERRDVDLRALPSGDYDLEVSVYRWRSGLRLMGLDRRSGERGDLLLIDQFEIPSKPPVKSASVSP